MRALFSWTVGVTCVVAALWIDWRAAGLMWLGTVFENILKWIRS